ncbi:MAG: hypothetical protein ACREDR_08245 [Blastocatellia bacterium]
MTKKSSLPIAVLVVLIASLSLLTIARVPASHVQSTVEQTQVKPKTHIAISFDRAKVKKAKDEHYHHFKEIDVLVAALVQRAATKDQIANAVHLSFLAETSVISKETRQLLRGKTDVDGALTALQKAPQRSYITFAIYTRLMGVEMPEGGTFCDGVGQGAYDQCYIDSCDLGPRGCDSVGCGYIADAAACRCYGGTFEADIDMCL